MVDIFKLPILIYISKDGCGACEMFNNEWDKIKMDLKNRAVFVRFKCTNEKKPPSCLAKYVLWFPCIVLAGPKSYFRCFTHNDKINEVDYDPNYTIKGKQFNAVESNGQIVFAGRNNNRDTVVNWFNQVHTEVMLNDELTYPKKYINFMQKIN